MRLDRLALFGCVSIFFTHIVCLSFSIHRLGNHPSGCNAPSRLWPSLRRRRAPLPHWLWRGCVSLSTGGWGVGPRCHVLCDGYSVFVCVCGTHFITVSITHLYLSSIPAPLFYSVFILNCIQPCKNDASPSRYAGRARGMGRSS